MQVEGLQDVKISVGHTYTPEVAHQIFEPEGGKDFEPRRLTSTELELMQTLYCAACNLSSKCGLSHNRWNRGYIVTVSREELLAEAECIKSRPIMFQTLLGETLPSAS